MNGTRRVTVDLPDVLIEDACRTSGLGIAETIVMGLQLLNRHGAAAKARALRGTALVDVDLGVSRGRTGR